MSRQCRGMHDRTKRRKQNHRLHWSATGRPARRRRMEEQMPMPTPTKSPGRFDHNGSHVWAIVLAGGEGVRLRPLVRHVCGDERPKQYVPLLDSRTLLRQTVDRAAQLVPAERIIVVTLQDHATYVANELRAGQTFRILVQPEGRGTAAGVLFPAHWIQA